MVNLADVISAPKKLFAEKIVIKKFSAMDLDRFYQMFLAARDGC
jgi:hypothetical protein